VFFKKRFITLIGILIGAIAGYLYWQQIGCASGTCLITSKPVNSSLYGALMGGLLFSIFEKRKKE
jgi:xanthine/uracil permease